MPTGQTWKLLAKHPYGACRAYFTPQANIQKWDTCAHWFKLGSCSQSTHMAYAGHTALLRPHIQKWHAYAHWYKLGSCSQSTLVAHAGHAALFRPTYESGMLLPTGTNLEAARKAIIWRMQGMQHSSSPTSEK
eukprot:1149429-Pelagomonas_calceolata.AAC.3